MLTLLLTGAFLFQGFQCASKNLTTAKVAYSNKDYPKAIDYLQKELQQNPNNAEAYAILADIYKEQGNLKLAAESAGKSFDLATTDELKTREQSLMQQIWIESYNNGINTFNNYNGTNKNVLDSATKSFDIGLSIRPNILDFYRFKGMISELKGDTTKAIELYKSYVNNMQPEVDLAIDKNFFLNMPRDRFLRAIGEKPINTITKITEAYDTNFIDIFKINDKELYAFSNANDNGDKLLVYWDYDPSPNLPNDEKTMQFLFNIEPFGALAQYYYQKKDLEQSFKYIDLITKLDPSNNEALRSKLALYQEMGKTDVALTEAQSLIRNDPSNKSSWAQLGDLQQNLKNYDEAIKSYEKALEIDPQFDAVLRNLGSAYKNKASIIQRSQQDKTDNDKTYKPNPEEYFPMLRKSADYFSKALKTEKYNSDFLILGELGNIYMVLGNEVELKKIARTLEGIFPLIQKQDLEKYYLNLLNIYGGTKENDKLQEAKQKLDALN